MGRTSGQSDFVFERPVDPEDVALPKIADPVTLPKATLWANLASSSATKWVLGFVALTLILLLVLTLVGPHIPSGE
jgi:hypothetical protein